MDFIHFPGANIVIAEDQPEYIPLPARVGVLPMAMPDGSIEGAIAVSCCAKLTPEELEHVTRTGTLFLTVLTYGAALQPIHGTFLEPQFIPEQK